MMYGHIFYMAGSPWRMQINEQEFWFETCPHNSQVHPKTIAAGFGRDIGNGVRSVFIRLQPNLTMDGHRISRVADHVVATG